MPRFHRHRRRPSRIRESGLYCIAVSTLLGIAMILVCLMGFAFIISRINAPAVLVSLLATVALGTGAYVGGYIVARKRRRSGMMLGVICGTLIFMIVVIIGAFFAKTALGLSAGGKLIIAMICGAVGGIVGVNYRNR